MKIALLLIVVVSCVLGLSILLLPYVFTQVSEVAADLKSGSSEQRLQMELRSDDDGITVVDSLVFQLKDEQGALLPIKTGKLLVQIHSSELGSMLEKRIDVELATAGELAIPPPYPSQGRVRVWLTVDDPKVGSFTGYANFAYQILDNNLANQKPAADITMSVCTPITGVVSDAATGDPISNAEVAPLQWGHHFAYAEWDRAVRTDSMGRYRFVRQYCDGVAARHPEYEIEEIETEKNQVDISLKMLTGRNVRIVDQDGKGIAGVDLPGDGVTDSDGRGVFRISPDDEGSYFLSHPNFESTRYPLEQLNATEETVISLRAIQPLRGRVFDVNGLPLQEGQVEVKFDVPGLYTRYNNTSDLQTDGTWSAQSFHTSSEDVRGHIRVRDANQVRWIHEFSLGNNLESSVEIRLPITHSFKARLQVNNVRNGKSIPIAFLYRDDLYWSAALPSEDGAIDFGKLPSGKYELKLEYQEILTPRGLGITPLSEVTRDGPSSNLDWAWETRFEINDAGVDLGVIDLDKLGLTTGSVSGQAFSSANESSPLAGWFGYLCDEDSDFTTVGTFEYYREFQLDQHGRFQLDECPPRTYMIRLSDRPNRSDGNFKVKVTPGRTTELKVFNQTKRNATEDPDD